MRAPDFLIIGAMKCGTTTLYNDLLTNPRVFMPAEKEPNALADDAVLEDAGRDAYLALFQGAASDQACGEASTRYSKLPDHPGVPARARRVCGPGLRVIYVVREPVSRIVSHHHHNHSAGGSGPDINLEVRQDPTFINWTRYAMQVEPWIEAFGRPNVRVVRFEDFIKDRPGTAASLAEFLGVPPRPELVDPDRVYNESKSKPVVKGALWHALANNRLYRGVLRPLLSSGLKERVRRLVLPKARALEPPTLETVEYVVGQVRSDAERLGAIMGLAGPPWDFEKVRKKYAVGLVADKPHPVGSGNV